MTIQQEAFGPSLRIPTEIPCEHAGHTPHFQSLVSHLLQRAWECGLFPDMTKEDLKLIAVLSAWVADAGAYFAGTFFGKHKLCPNISPKKTIEGAIGGVVVDVLVMLLCGVLFTELYYQGQAKADYLVLFIIGFFGAALSILGDLSFSIIKRSCHIKDFGQVIPGHGGILDRFDSVIFTAPFVYLLVSFLPLAGA